MAKDEYTKKEKAKPVEDVEKEDVTDDMVVKPPTTLKPLSSSRSPLLPPPTGDITIARRKRSSWWYLLPIFLEVIGGVIAYFVLRTDDHRLARNCLWLGIILSAIHWSFAILALVLFDFSII